MCVGEPKESGVDAWFCELLSRRDGEEEIRPTTMSRMGTVYEGVDRREGQGVT